MSSFQRWFVGISLAVVLSSLGYWYWTSSRQREEPTPTTPRPLPEKASPEDIDVLRKEIDSFYTASFLKAKSVAYKLTEAECKPLEKALKEGKEPHVLLIKYMRAELGRSFEKWPNDLLSNKLDILSGVVLQNIEEPWVSDREKVLEWCEKNTPLPILSEIENILGRLSIMSKALNIYSKETLAQKRLAFEKAQQDLAQAFKKAEEYKK